MSKFIFQALVRACPLLATSTCNASEQTWIAQAREALTHEDSQERQLSLMVGQYVRKIGGDYRFDGIVRAVFAKGSGETRYVVEDDRGVLHIYSRKNLEGGENPNG
jgi:hypothetical protein